MSSYAGASIDFAEYKHREDYIINQGLRLDKIKELWPNLLPVDTLEDRILLIEQLGLDKKILNHAPIFGYSNQNILDKVDLITKQLGLDKNC